MGKPKVTHYVGEFKRSSEKLAVTRDESIYKTADALLSSGEQRVTHSSDLGQSSCSATPAPPQEETVAKSLPVIQDLLKVVTNGELHQVEEYLQKRPALLTESCHLKDLSSNEAGGIDADDFKKEASAFQLAFWLGDFLMCRSMLNYFQGEFDAQHQFFALEAGIRNGDYPPRFSLKETLQAYRDYVALEGKDKVKRPAFWKKIGNQQRHHWPVWLWREMSRKNWEDTPAVTHEIELMGSETRQTDGNQERMETALNRLTNAVALQFKSDGSSSTMESCEISENKERLFLARKTRKSLQSDCQAVDKIAMASDRDSKQLALHTLNVLFNVLRIRDKDEVGRVKVRSKEFKIETPEFDFRYATDDQYEFFMTFMRLRSLQLYVEETALFELTQRFACQKKREKRLGRLKETAASSTVSPATSQHALMLAKPTSRDMIEKKAAETQHKVMQREVDEMMFAVGYGQLEMVKDCLERNPNLLHALGTIFDPAGRVFVDITAFQYAVWANDIAMDKVFMDKFENKKDAGNQLKALEEDNTLKAIHGSQFTLEAIEKAYAEVIHQINKQDWSYYQKIRYCCRTIGKYQRDFTVSIISDMTEPGSNAPWTKKKIGDNRRNHLGIVSRRHGKWLALEDDEGRCEWNGVSRAIGVTRYYVRGDGVNIVVLPSTAVNERYASQIYIAGLVFDRDCIGNDQKAIYEYRETLTAKSLVLSQS